MGCKPTKEKPIISLHREFSLVTSLMINDMKKIPQQYVIKGLLGHGSNCRVLLSESIETFKKVAIKVIPKSSSSLEQLMQEIEILSKVDHPNIVKYFKHYESAKYLYVVMEYCGGGDLFQKIIDQPKFTEIEAAIIMEKLLRAINHCHHLGIIHRDLKPENIMYTSEGVLKILDFGLSIKTNTFTNDVFAGTSYYIAPEILIDRIFTEACDIWSLGIIMHILLSGSIAIGGNSFEEICERIKRYRGPNFKSEVWKEISTEAKDLLKKMLNTDYEERITASEALKHPWFTSIKTNTSVSNKVVVEALKRYSEFSVLKKNMLKLIAKNLNEKEVKEYQEAFLDLDKEKIGMITYNNLKEILHIDKSDINEIEELKRSINHDGKGFINYSLFVSALIAKNKFYTEKELESLFRILQFEQQECLRSKSLLITEPSSPNEEIFKSKITSKEITTIIIN